MICDTFDNLLEPHVAEYIESETRKEAWVPMNFNKNGKPYYRGCEDQADTRTGGLALFGNLFPNLSIIF